MGKEGGYWGGGRSLKRAEPETPGCISSFFQFFDFHPFHFSFQHHNHQSQQQQPQPSFNFDHTTASSISKGTQAPRNSLESEDATIMGVGSSISTKQENLEIPKKNKLFIKTSTGIISGNSKVGNIVNDNLSPGTKTPTLVARLMGLDLLPDSQSPSSSSPSSSSTTTSSYLSATKSQVNLHQQQHHHHHHLRPRQHRNVVVTKPRHSMDDSIAASRFLSDTPRISSARISDVEHRLSLQINKENMGVVGEDLELPRFSFSKLKFEEQRSGNKSPRQFAKQIVKQVRESVLMSGKVGTDVTNTVKNTERGGSEIFVGQFRCKKSPRTTPTCSSSDELSSPGKVSNNRPSCSPRLRFMDPKNIISTVTTAGKDPIPPKPLVKFDNNQPQVVSKAILVEQEAHHQFQKQKSLVPKCKKAANEKFSPRLKKPNNVRNKQDESFVRPLLSSSCDKKSTSGISKRSSQPLLINLLNLNSAVKNTNSNITPPAATTKIPQKQTQESVAREAKYCCSSQLSSGSSQTYTRKEEATSPSSPPCITLSTTTTGESNVDELDKRKISVYGSMFNNGPEFEYVSSILSSTGFAVKKGTTKTNSSTVSVPLFRQWLSPTQPLDPSIFHHLEQQFQNQNQNHQNQKNYPTCDASSLSSQDRSLRPKYDVGIRCNRRLLFDLVNETLLEVVGPCDEEAVWERIGKLQRDKKCEVLEDIDALIEMEDLGETMMKMKSAGELVAEIEGNIMDTLLHETVMMVTERVAGGGDCGTERTTTTPFSRGGAYHVGGSRDG